MSLDIRRDGSELGRGSILLSLTAADTPCEYDRAINAFDKLRNNRKIETFAGKIEFDLAYGEHESALAELVKRPGELARRLDTAAQRDI